MISILSSFSLESFKLQNAELKRQMISKHFNSRYQVVALEVSIIESQCTVTSSYGNMKIAPKVFVYWSDRCRRVKIRQFELQSHFGGLVSFPCLNYFNNFSIKAPTTSKSSPGFHEKSAPNFIIITLHSNHPHFFTKRRRKKPPLFLEGTARSSRPLESKLPTKTLKARWGQTGCFWWDFCHHGQGGGRFFLVDKRQQIMTSSEKR